MISMSCCFFALVCQSLGERPQRVQVKLTKCKEHVDDRNPENLDLTWTLLGNLVAVQQLLPKNSNDPRNDTHLLVVEVPSKQRIT